MKRYSPIRQKSAFWLLALLAKGQMLVETGLDGSVWTVLAGKWNPGTMESRLKPGWSGRVFGRFLGRPEADFREGGLVGGTPPLGPIYKRSHLQKVPFWPSRR